MAIRNVGYDRGFFRPACLHKPVISVGNLSTGGSGKTPFVIALARLLAANDISVDVLSRGYGRRRSEVTAVPQDGGGVDAYGDEPLLIAREARVHVFVGSSRVLAGQLAEKSVKSDVHLLDDGFQHRQLKRDLDVVLLLRRDLRDLLLPAGYLREPLSALRRAGAVVLREEDRDLEMLLGGRMRADAQFWHVKRSLSCPAIHGPVVAFCGIAWPDEFFAGLRALGMQTAGAVAFDDHHQYSDRDVQLLLDRMQRFEARAVVTTEKDAVRLTPVQMARLEGAGKLVVAKLEVHFSEPERVLQAVRGVVATGAQAVDG